ncbi:UNVERIFIED_CONTAM: Magnesium transporter MRS2-I [Sesamum calycinum]|uniref:Magnesium transporter n=1 Tax=Sesamum calycinum TaxID=2727403 RepID=A0AAW2QKA3_9LAMI
MARYGCKGPLESWCIFIVLICASSSDNVTPVMEELQRRLTPSNNNQEEELMLQHDLEMSEEDDLPFEFQALEVAVEAICTYLDAHTTELETALYPALDMITSKGAQIIPTNYLEDSLKLFRIVFFTLHKLDLSPPAPAPARHCPSPPLPPQPNLCLPTPCSSSVLPASPPPKAPKVTIPSIILIGMATGQISSSNLDRIRKLKNQLTKLTARVQRIRDELEQILDNHDHMVNLCLSRKLVRTSPESGFDAANPALSTTGSIKISCGVSRTSLAAVQGDENNVGELEMLLEAYFVQIDRTLNKLTTLREYVGSTQDFINIQLELFLSAGTLCINMISVVAGLFGVNIPYKWNYGHGYMYKWVLIIAGTFSGLVFVIIISQARRRGLVG